MDTLSLSEIDSLLDSQTIQVGSDLNVYSSTADKKYDELLKCWNVTSYSQRELLHACPRKYQLSMHEAAKGRTNLEGPVNIDFTFGHAVGAGVQTWLLTKSIDKALFNAFMAWRAPFEERVATKRKSLWEACLAIESFAAWWQSSGLDDDWELAVLPNGKSAIELAFSIHAPDGFKDYGHIDIVLKAKYADKYAVFELKTTAAGADEAQYANSDQATGYSLTLSSIWKGITDYTVYYCVFETKSGKWRLLPFDKLVRERAEWIKSLMLDHSAIKTYQELGFFPKRGSSCFSFNSRCKFFGSCNMVPDEELPRLDEDQEAEPVDAVIQLADVIAELKSAKRGS